MSTSPLDCEFQEDEDQVSFSLLIYPQYLAQWLAYSEASPVAQW